MVLIILLINNFITGRMGHSLALVPRETFGSEEVSIRETAYLWSKNVSCIIGPQETCVHEGRMAASFNLPMISYVSYV